MISYSFSGHETFSLRHGWLKKGIDGVSQKTDFFSTEDTMIRLGVGRNMVQSIRHWCLATQIVQDSEKRGELVPTDLGRSIFLDGNFDPYLEDSATLWLLHWHLATNLSHSTTWFWMFNYCNHAEFNKEKIALEIQSWLEKQGNKKSVSENTLERDINCFLRTYVVSCQTKTAVSEDSLDCPLTDLRLMTELDKPSKTYQFNRGSQDSLPDEIFVYTLAKFWRMKERPESIALSKLMLEIGSPVRIFKLDENSLVNRLEKIETISEGAFAYDETAGLKQIYRRGEIDLTSLLERCYRKKVKKAGSAK